MEEIHSKFLQYHIPSHYCTLNFVRQTPSHAQDSILKMEKIVQNKCMCVSMRGCSVALLVAKINVFETFLSNSPLL